jgi:Tol biopolymer transport system component
MWGMAVTADTKHLVVIKATEQSQVYIGELTAGGTRMNSPRRLTSNEANALPSSWTPDSKAVLFTSNRNGTQGVFEQQINADEAQPMVTGQQDAFLPRVSADGKWILYQEVPKAAKVSTPLRLMRIPIAGGVPQFVLELNIGDVQCALPPASVCVLSEETEDHKQWTVSEFDPVKGKGRLLRSIQKPRATSPSYDLSPDGKTFAVASEVNQEIHIRMLSLVDTSDREVTVKGWASITGFNWSADGKGFYCGSVTAQGATLLYVDFAGNARVLWQNNGGNLAWGIPSPDGRHLAILARGQSRNVWMLEGF